MHCCFSNRSEIGFTMPGQYETLFSQLVTNRPIWMQPDSPGLADALAYLVEVNRAISSLDQPNSPPGLLALMQLHAVVCIPCRFLPYSGLL